MKFQVTTYLLYEKSLTRSKFRRMQKFQSQTVYYNFSLCSISFFSFKTHLFLSIFHHWFFIKFCKLLRIWKYRFLTRFTLRYRFSDRVMHVYEIYLSNEIEVATKNYSHTERNLPIKFQSLHIKFMTVQMLCEN